MTMDLKVRSFVFGIAKGSDFGGCRMVCVVVVLYESLEFHIFIFYFSCTASNLILNRRPGANRESVRNF